MNKKYRLVSTTLLLMLALGLILSAPLTSAQDSEEDSITQVDTYFMQLTEDDKFSGSVLIARDGEILLNKGYGFAVREWQVPNTPDTKFRIGHITRQFTAMAIVILEERGLLTVDDLICQYIDNCPEAWADITIYHLLTHTSGIPNYTYLRDYNNTKALQVSPKGLIGRFIDEPLVFAPGEKFSWCDSGFIVLGHIIEEVSVMSYGRFLSENIFRPLGMENSGYDSGRRVLENHAMGYVNPNIKADFIHMSVFFAADGMYSTVEDLYRWQLALLDGDVISQESWDRILESAVPYENILNGYGLIIYSGGGHLLIGRGTNIDGFGFTNSMRHYLDDNLTAIVLSNLGSIPSDVPDVIEDIILGE